MRPATDLTSPMAGRGIRFRGRAQFSSGPDDAAGEAIFADHFLPTFVDLYQIGRAQGKGPLDLLAPDSKDEIAQPLIGIFGRMRADMTLRGQQVRQFAPVGDISSIQNTGDDQTPAPNGMNDFSPPPVAQPQPLPSPNIPGTNIPDLGRPEQDTGPSTMSPNPPVPAIDDAIDRNTTVPAPDIDRRQMQIEPNLDETLNPQPRPTNVGYTI